jgi:uncharacterized membrane protein HdeD (DUF308 family)
MSPRQKDGVIAVVSGAVTLISGILAIVLPVDPAWLAPLVACIGAVMTVIFGVKAKIGK